MVNIDINIPMDRRTAIAAGAVFVAAAGGLAYCALRPRVKLVCAESIAPAMRAVGDKSPFALSVTPVADGDCTADKVSSLASSRGADVIIWKNNAPFEDLDGSGLENLQSIASELSSKLSYAVNTQVEIKSLPVCGDGSVIAFNEELVNMMGGELPGDSIQINVAARDLQERYPSGAIGIEDSAGDSWGLAACMDYFAAAVLGTDLIDLQLTANKSSDESASSNDNAGHGMSPLSRLPLLSYCIDVDDQASQSSTALETGFREGRYPMALMRYSSFASLKAAGVSCEAVRLLGQLDMVTPIMYPSYSLSIPSGSSTATEFIKWLLQADAQGVLCSAVNHIPTARGTEAPDVLKKVYGDLLDSDDGSMQGEPSAEDSGEGAQSSESVPGDSQASGDSASTEAPPLVYALPSWMSLIDAKSRDRYMADAREAVKAMRSDS